MIIIKSQDGKRFKECTEIYNAEKTIWGIKEVTTNEEDLYGECVIGEYDSEERAKEVMGEIEAITEYISNVKIFGVQNCMNSLEEIGVKYPKLLITSVYTMPEK